jgi:hypothetical protein
MSKVNVRYIVNDVDAAIPFYTGLLGFKLDMHPAPGSRACRVETCSCCSTVQALEAPGRLCRMGRVPLPEAGIEFRSRLKISKQLSKNSTEQERSFVTRS